MTSRWARVTVATLSVLFSACAGLSIGVGPAWAALAPAIIQQPAIAVVGVGEHATFVAAAEGDPVPTVQWEESASRTGPWTPVTGANQPTLSFSPSESDYGHAYRAVFTNPAGTVASRPARLVLTNRWMEDLGDDIADVPLTELTIPGTHDMGTYGITDDSHLSTDDNTTFCQLDHAVCRAYGIAQSTDATQELIRGIRYFDLRVCGHHTGYPEILADLSADPYTCHGLEGGSLADILYATRLFVNQDPGEVVILDINHEFKVDPDVVAQQVEDAFATPTGSLLIPPQYCGGDPDNGTCAGSLTLRTIRDQHLGNVIVNFENDGGSSDWEPGCTGLCPVPDKPRLDTAFYDRHPLLWGRADGPPPTSHGDQCTRGAAFPSCYGNVDTNQDAQDRAVQSLQERQTRGDSGAGGHYQRFFVQFLQTTPDSGTIASDNGGGSLRGEAVGGPIAGVAFEDGSNPLIGPAVLGCGDTAALTGTCFAQERPEDVNILALNFFQETDYTHATNISQGEVDDCTSADRSRCPLSPDEQATVHCGFPLCWYTDPVHFDLVGDSIAFDDEKYVAPVVTIDAREPASTGWYNAQTLGGQGQQLAVSVTAQDYAYPTGIDALDCLDGADVLPTDFAGPTPQSTVVDFTDLHDGIHNLDCRATDGAHDGLRGQGNRGAGPGSTTLPRTFRIDTVPPTLAPTVSPDPVPLGAVATGDAHAADALSGVDPGTTGCGTIDTSTDGVHAVTCTATDQAGNVSTATAHYSVYRQLGSGATTCDGTYGGSGRDVTVPAGAHCTLIAGTTVTHDVTVRPGGSLTIGPATVGHDLQAVGATALTACGVQVAHDLQVTGSPATSTVLIGGAAPCGPNTVGHDLRASDDAGSTTVTGNAAGHDLQCDNDPALHGSGNTAADKNRGCPA